MHLRLVFVVDNETKLLKNEKNFEKGWFFQKLVKKQYYWLSEMVKSVNFSSFLL